MLAIKKTEIYARIKRSPLTIVGIIIVSFIIVLGIFGPYFVPYDISEINPSARLLPPNSKNFFGTDELGRDIFSRVITGIRVSIISSFTIILVAMSIGILIGTLSGFFGGYVDDVLMRITDMFMAIPTILWSLAIAASAGGGLQVTIFAISTKWWTSYSRITRERFLNLKQHKFIEAAKASGISDLRIIVYYLLPNSLTPLIVKASQQIGRAIMYTATLSFIGVGAKPPTPEWGLMLTTAKRYLPSYWWYAFFPGLFMSVLIFGLNLIGDGLRDLMDPKFRGRIEYDM